MFYLVAHGHVYGGERVAVALLLAHADELVGVHREAAELDGVGGDPQLGEIHPLAEDDGQLLLRHGGCGYKAVAPAQAMNLGLRS